MNILKILYEFSGCTKKCEFAEITGSSRDSVYNWINGKGNQRYLNMMYILDAYKMTMYLRNPKGDEFLAYPNSTREVFEYIYKNSGYKTRKAMYDDLGISYKLAMQWHNEMQNPMLDTFQKIVFSFGYEIVFRKESNGMIEEISISCPINRTCKGA